MPHKMTATFSDSAYDALMNGEAVDNNGLRSTEGYFWPDQPTFSPQDDNIEALKKAGVGLVILLGYEVVYPGVKRFAHEKFYPYVVRKWDKWAKSKMDKQSSTEETNSTSESANPSLKKKVINLNEYRKRA